jgi:hypothetical protein
LWDVHYGFFVGHLSAIKVVNEIAVIAARQKAESSKGGPLSLPSCSHELTPEVFAETILGDRFIPAFFSPRALTLQMVFRSTEGSRGRAAGSEIFLTYQSELGGGGVK